MAAFTSMLLIGLAFLVSVASVHLGCPDYTYSPLVSELAEQAKSWCIPERVPADIRAPEKLQGLFYFKGNEWNPIAPHDFAACFSLGTFDWTTLTLTLRVAHDFVFRDDIRGAKLHLETLGSGMYYTFQFSDRSLTYAKIRPHNALLPGRFDMTEQVNDEQHPGDSWERETYMVKMFPYNVYYLARILDGNLTIREEANADMISRWSASQKVCVSPAAPTSLLVADDAKKEQEATLIPLFAFALVAVSGLVLSLIVTRSCRRSKDLNEPLLDA